MSVKNKDISKRFLAVVNPAAGGGKCGKNAAAAIERLRAAGVEVDVVETRAAGDATRLVRQAWQEGRRDFIAVGGDGTGYEMVNGLFPEALESEDTPSLGFLPLGTGNSFLRDFTDQGAEYSIDALIAGRERPCDVISLECDEQHLHYINILSIGFTADVGSLTNRRFKPLGEGGYVLAVVTEVARLRAKRYPIHLDGGPVDDGLCTFISINNSKYTGGKMMMAPHALVDDGFAAVVHVGEMGRISLLRTFPKIFKGTHVDHPAIRTTKVKEIDFDVDQPLDLMIDGEVVRFTPRRLHVLPGALRVRV